MKGQVTQLRRYQCGASGEIREDPPYCPIVAIRGPQGRVIAIRRYESVAAGERYLGKLQDLYGPYVGEAQPCERWILDLLPRLELCERFDLLEGLGLLERVAVNASQASGSRIG